MNFGHFDDANKEYVITTPDTPLPWINYLGSQDFFTLISNTCGGYSFYKDAKLLRITRYRRVPVPFGLAHGASVTCYAGGGPCCHVCRHEELSRQMGRRG